MTHRNRHLVLSLISTIWTAGLASGCGGDTSSSRPTRRYLTDGTGGSKTTAAGTGGAGTGSLDTIVDCRGQPITYPALSALTAIAELPDPFLRLDVTRMVSPTEWACRREELKAYAQYYEYGPLPPAPTKVTGELEGVKLRVIVEANGLEASYMTDIALPTGDGPFPVMIHISAGTPVLEAAKFTERGYAFIFLDTTSVAADSASRSGAFYTLYPKAETGVLMAWAWGVHRIVDALASVSQIDAAKVMVNGFSRWGKGALLAGAFDERIALTVPSSSGLSGTGQYRFFYEDPTNRDSANEKIGNAWSNASYWFVGRFGQFTSQVTKLPFDQHEIIALVAPRALIATQGRYDYWTNPRGTSISWRAAQTVFDYVGAPNQIGIVWDDVAHALTDTHLAYLLDFADVQFKDATSTRDFHATPAEFADEPTAHPWSAP